MIRNCFLALACMLTYAIVESILALDRSFGMLHEVSQFNYNLHCGFWVTATLTVAMVFDTIIRWPVEVNHLKYRQSLAAALTKTSFLLSFWSGLVTAGHSLANSVGMLTMMLICSFMIRHKLKNWATLTRLIEVSTRDALEEVPH